MADFSSTIPRCAVELLFAEDLIDRIMRRHTGCHFKAWRAAPYRNFVFNAFSDEIAEAVDFIDAMLEWEMDETFSRMVDDHQVNRETFVDYARHFEDLCFKQGFDADNFLNFCVRLVSLAAYYAQFGEPVALELALIFVTKVMTNYDLFEGGWDTLKAVAKKYVERKEDFCRVVTPEVSDDESLMNVLDDEEEDESLMDDLEQDSSFGIDEEEKAKDELDRQRLDFSGLDLSSSYEAERYMANEDDEFAIISEEKSQDEPDPKLDLPAISTNDTEGYISNGYGESTIIQEKKSQDKPDRQRMESPGSECDLPTSFLNEAKVSTSDVGDESSITLAEKPQDTQNDEKIDLSGSKLEQPACSGIKEKIKTGDLPSAM